MTNGIYTDLSIDDYHANGTHVSATQIKIAKRSLKEWYWYRHGLMKKEKKGHFDFGNAFELALMDHVAFSEDVIVYDERLRPELNKGITSEKNQVWKKALLNGDKYVIQPKGDESYEAIEQMIESCYKDAVIQKLISNTEYQTSIFWTDDQTGLNMKTRPDICKSKKNIIVNIKTTKDGSPKAFSQDLAKYDYPLQACIEIEGCVASGLMQSVDNYFWLVVEKVPPFNATVYEFDKTDIAPTMDELEYVKNKIKRAEDEKLFPGYTDRADNPHGILKAEIPMWYRLAGL
jgi:hypothetical protein